MIEKQSIEINVPLAGNVHIHRDGITAYILSIFEDKPAPRPIDGEDADLRSSGVDEVCHLCGWQSQEFIQ
jgi:hypothetical protein